MQVLRFFLLVASVVGAAYVFLRSSHWKVPGHGAIDSLAFRVRIGLKYHFSNFCGPIVTGNSRFAYLLRLWHNAKLRQLRERAGEPPRLD